MTKSRFLTNTRTKQITGCKSLHLIQNKIRKDSFNMAKCFRAENTKFIKMPTGTSYDRGTCVCSSRTVSTATTAISKMPTGKKKALPIMAYMNIATKVVSSLQCIDSITALEIGETVLIQRVSL